MKKTLLGYVPESSPAYVLHPSSRLIALSILTLIPLFILDPRINGSLIVLTLIAFPLSRIPFTVFRTYLPLFVLLAVFIGAVYTLFPDPRLQTRVLFDWGSVVLYRGSLLFSLAIYLRIASILLLTIYFLHVMTEREIVVGMRSLGVPFIVCYILGLAFRAIGMFMDDYRTIRQAEKARALSLSDLPWTRRIGKLIQYIVPLLALMIRRTDEFSDAILSRGFSFSATGERPNVIGHRFRFNHWDVAALTVLIGATVILLVWRFL